MQTQKIFPMNNEICTAIVTYNRLDLLKDAIKSIQNQNTHTDILVVNNGSTDGTANYLKTIDGITIITQDNVGGAGGFFTALKYIAEHGYKFAWIMDDDIVANPTTLTELVNAYEEISKEEKVGFLCSSVYSADGDTVNVPSISTTHNPTGYPDWNKWLNKCYVKVDMATFVSVFLSVDIIKEVGLPYKEYFIWGDDTEYTQRISSKYPCYLVGKSKITHLRNGGKLSLYNIDDPNRIKMFRFYIRNNMNNQRLYSSRRSLLRFLKSYLKDGIKFIFKGKLKKSEVIFKGLYSSIGFHPEICYPKNEGENNKDN